MMKKPIGLIIKELAEAKNLRVTKLAELTGKARTTIYQTFGRSEMSDEELTEWAKVLDVDKNYLFDRWKNDDEEIVNKPNVDLLAEQMLKIEATMREMFAQQLAIKDKQIEGLQRTVDVLLGKSECVTEKTGKVIELVAYEVGQIA